MCLSRPQVPSATLILCFVASFPWSLFASPFSSVFFVNRIQVVRTRPGLFVDTMSWIRHLSQSGIANDDGLLRPGSPDQPRPLREMPLLQMEVNLHPCQGPSLEALFVTLVTFVDRVLLKTRCRRESWLLTACPLWTMSQPCKYQLGYTSSKPLLPWL
ncbi:hypothetical protein B0I37DRAFT_382242 [Chaetomium sp. MPI-CAGE-AT-0009]|nr:hypothetical protein B0I37DRAFT_382242 [Chaetomium sp. MPI-CAGE-AT-0009]